MATLVCSAGARNTLGPIKLYVLRIRTLKLSVIRLNDTDNICLEDKDTEPLRLDTKDTQTKYETLRLEIKGT